MNVYVLKNKEQFVHNMSKDEILAYCEANNMEAFRINTSFVMNDWNWHRQFPSLLHICASNLSEVKDFILNGYYHADEYDGESGVIFHEIAKLERMSV